MALNFNPEAYGRVFEAGQNREDQRRQELAQALQAIPQGFGTLAQMQDKKRMQELQKFQATMELQKQGFVPQGQTQPMEGVQPQPMFNQPGMGGQMEATGNPGMSAATGNPIIDGFEKNKHLYVPKTMKTPYGEFVESPEAIQGRQTKITREELEQDKLRSEAEKNRREPVNMGITPYQEQNLELQRRRLDQQNVGNRETQKIAVKKQTTMPKEKALLNNALAGFDRMIQEAEAIKNHPSLATATGMSSFMGKIKGTGAYNVRSRIETLKSKTGFQVLQEMRNNSPTGGALGQVSEKENQLLQDNIASLDVGQNDDDYRNALDRVIDYASSAKQRLQSAFDDYYSDTSEGMTSGQGQNTAEQKRMMLRQKLGL